MMKKWIGLICSVLMVFSLTACSAQVNESEKNVSENTSAAAAENETAAQEEAVEQEGSNEKMNRQIKVTGANGETIVFELNNTPAAEGLYNQLPLTVEVENFSNNEKIFYPANELSTKDTPLARSGVGTLAYYAPWGNVVMFYRDFSSNSSLYRLGQAVSGGELIGELSGTITVEKVE